MTDATPKRTGRMNRSRWTAAGTSVGALVALTAGVAAANPAPSGTNAKTTGSHPATGTGSSVRDSGESGDDDSGWVPAPDSGTQGNSDPGFTDPSAGGGWSDPGFADPNSGSNSGGFAPGTGSAGRTSSGGS